MMYIFRRFSKLLTNQNSKFASKAKVEEVVVDPHVDEEGIARVLKVNPFKDQKDPVELPEKEYPQWLFELADERGRIRPLMNPDGTTKYPQEKKPRKINTTARYMKRLLKMNILARAEFKNTDRNKK